MIISFIRTIILYVLVVSAIRIMGKRQIGELQPSELVIAIMISDLASVPMSDIGIPLTNGIIPILTLIVAEVMISIINLKSPIMRNVITGKPSILIKNGIIQENEMRENRYNIQDLLEELRQKDYFDLSEVYMAILETNGKISIIPRENKRPLKAEDFNITTSQQDMPFIVIADGKIRPQHLKESGHNFEWIKKQLEKYNISKIEDVFFMSVDSVNHVSIQRKEGR